MYYFIVNPVAGNGLSKKAAADIAKKLDSENIEYEIVYTSSKGHATELAAKAKDRGIKSIVAVGGDGTVLEVASGLFYSDCVLGIIPSGTGNDLIKALGIAKDPLLALEVILGGHIRIVDTGLCGDRPFLNAFGTGLDAQVVIKTNKVKKIFKGFLAYLAGIFMAFVTFDPPPITVETDKMHITQKMMFLSIANGICIGGGINIAPKAIPDDGFLDMLIIDKVSKPEVLRYLPTFMKGTHLGLPIVHDYKIKKVQIDSPMPLVIQIDGEVITESSVEVSIREKALRVFVPAE